jgi:hypothetical protein
MSGLPDENSDKALSACRDFFAACVALLVLFLLGSAVWLVGQVTAFYLATGGD